jgi:hypothetical protein
MQLRQYPMLLLVIGRGPVLNQKYNTHKKNVKFHSPTSDSSNFGDDWVLQSYPGESNYRLRENRQSPEGGKMK